MIRFRRRSKHKVKLKNKPIQEGYKVWAIAQRGYIITWLWHSKEEGPEGISKGQGLQVEQIKPFPPITLPPTLALVIVLARDLRTTFPDQKFYFFLDNLFLNIPIAHCLLKLDI